VEEELMDESRRKFINLCLGGVAALGVTAFAAVSYPVVRYYLIPPADKNSTGKTVIPLDALIAGEARFFEFNGAAAVVVKKQDGNLAVLSAVCPHLGCIVQWEADRQDFLCPCHAGYFTADGAVISGPPPRALAKIPFVVLNGVVTIG
jgi:cytochrome b6-f complex iron-sulfur subunit